ncbi:MAG: hypothetical protein K2M07_00485 [Muribaculaceae bacterium]|nr:hypothetical protein [Muribaculaceae bacterium]
MKRILLILLTVIFLSVSQSYGAEKSESRLMTTPQNSGTHFAWGADLGSSIDMTGNSMTSINIGGFFGYRNNWFRVLGIGGEIHSMMSNSSRSIPIYGIMQTSFCNRPRLCFMDLRGGISMNNIENANTQTGGYTSIGVGVTLAHSRKFSSHFILAYTFIQRKDFDDSETSVHIEDLQMATLRIGVCF